MKIDEIKSDIEFEQETLVFLKEKRARMADEATSDYEEAFNRGMATAYSVAIDTLEEILKRFK